MSSDENAYFEIESEGNVVRIEVLKFSDGQLEHDRDWLVTKISLKGGNFSGVYEGAFIVGDFQRFKSQIQTLRDNFKDSANFKGLEDHIEITLVGDGVGHFKVEVLGRDRPWTTGGILSFSFEIDQTHLNPLIEQLEEIAKRFPAPFKK